MKKKLSTASKKLSHGQQNTQPSRLTPTIFPPPKNQASTEKLVQLDLNNAEFQRTSLTGRFDFCREISNNRRAQSGACLQCFG